MAAPNFACSAMAIPAIQMIKKNVNESTHLFLFMTQPPLETGFILECLSLPLWFFFCFLLFSPPF
jgi:hypothetical protein